MSSASENLNIIRQREETVDPDSERLESVVASPKGPDGAGKYTEAKTLYLQKKRILSAAEQRLAMDRAEWASSTPPKIWERAEPAPHPTRFRIRRIWDWFSR